MNKYIRSLIIALIAAVALTSCSDEPHGAASQAVTTYRVAVVMPGTDRDAWQRTVAWALDNVAKAQRGLDRAVSLDIEWIDEDAADLDASLDRIAEDDGIVALIGPMSSQNARNAAERLKKSQKTIILPIATSTEFQRVYADRGNVWNLTQSDMTQSEILLTQAKLSGNMYVTLLTGDDDYGKSYSDWFAYQALELGLKVGDIHIYGSEEQLREAVRDIAASKGIYQTTVVFAPSRAEDAVIFDNEYGVLKGDKDYLKFPALLCADVVNSTDVAPRLVNREYEGVSPSANPASGFTSAYRERFGVEPVSGEAHLFDAVTMVAYALAADGDADISYTLHRLLESGGSGYGSWLPDDMALTFARLQGGGAPDLGGVTGNWDFDKKYGTTVLNTIYAHWILRDGRYTTIEYLSTDGGDRTTSTLQAWDTATNSFQQFANDQPDRDYGALDGNWAVVISTSDTWANYRHQADALAMYQLLKRHGYDDDHIILIMEDNIAYDSRNPHPGYVKVRPDGENLYTDVKVDYKLSATDIDDLEDIMTGDALGSDAHDNVIVFWTGHGANSQLYWGSYNTVAAQRIRRMIASMNERGKYRKMMFVMDACYSGTIGEACTGIPGVLFVTAANAYEPSKADMKDPETGVWLSNGFTRVFQETIDADPSISIRNLYYTLARNTTGSHATVYNVENYGNVFTNRMDEFLK